MAQWLSLPGMWWGTIVADQARFVGVRRVPASDERDGGHHLPGHPKGTPDLVPCRVVGVRAEERCKCRFRSAAFGFRELRDRVDMDA